MTEFHPGDLPSTPTPVHAYGQTAPAAPEYLTVVMPPAPGTEPQPAPQPYAQPAPQPYAQPAPQPYAQPAPQPYAQQAPPPAAWPPPASTQRKVWPWVVGGIGTLALLGIAGVIAVVLMGKAAVDGLNSDYDAPEVTAQDTATSGGTIVISDDAAMAFEPGPDWTNETSTFLGDFGDVGDVRITFTGAWTIENYGADPSATIVMALAGKEPLPLVRSSLEVEHALFIDSFTESFTQQGSAVTMGQREDATTSSGLAGLSSTFTASMQTGLMQGEIHSFARGNNVVFVVTLSTSMSGSDAAMDQVLETLRLDK